MKKLLPILLLLGSCVHERPLCPLSDQPVAITLNIRPDQMQQTRSDDDYESTVHELDLYIYNALTGKLFKHERLDPTRSDHRVELQTGQWHFVFLGNTGGVYSSQFADYANNSWFTFDDENDAPWQDFDALKNYARAFLRGNDNELWGVMENDLYPIPLARVFERVQVYSSSRVETLEGQNLLTGGKWPVALDRTVMRLDITLELTDVQAQAFSDQDPIYLRFPVRAQSTYLIPRPDAVELTRKVTNKPKQLPAYSEASGKADNSESGVVYDHPSKPGYKIVRWHVRLNEWMLAGENDKEANGLKLEIDMPTMTRSTVLQHDGTFAFARNTRTTVNLTMKRDQLETEVSVAAWRRRSLADDNWNIEQYQFDIAQDEFLLDATPYTDLRSEIRTILDSGWWMESCFEIDSRTTPSWIDVRNAYGFAASDPLVFDVTANTEQTPRAAWITIACKNFRKKILVTQLPESPDPWGGNNRLQASDFTAPVGATRNWVGAYWRANERGERLLEYPIVYDPSKNGADRLLWGAQVLYISPGFNRGDVLFDEYTPDTPPANRDAESHRLDGIGHFYLAPRFVERQNGQSKIRLRLGLLSRWSDNPAYDPVNAPARYAVVALWHRIERGGTWARQLLFLRQGDRPDYIYHPSDWPAAQKISTANLTTTVPSENPVERIAPQGSLPAMDGTLNRYTVGSRMADYPTQAGSLFFPSTNNSSHSRYAYHPSMEVSPYPNYWANDATTWDVVRDETCPPGYRRPTTKEIEHTLALPVLTPSDLNNPDTPMAPTLFCRGEYADGLYDRYPPQTHRPDGKQPQAGAIDMARLAHTAEAAYAGTLFFNLRTDSRTFAHSVFLPHAGYREFLEYNKAINPVAGMTGRYLTSDMNSVMNFYLWLSPQLTEGIASNQSWIAASVRCVKN